MVKFVISLQIPPVFLSDADREAVSENPTYIEWIEQDYLLCTWIISTISSSLLLRFVRFRNSRQVLEDVHNYYFK